MKIAYVFTLVILIVGVFDAGIAEQNKSFQITKVNTSDISKPQDDRLNPILRAKIFLLSTPQEENRFIALVSKSKSGYDEALFQLNSSSKDELAGSDKDHSKSRVAIFMEAGDSGFAGNIIMASPEGNFSVGVVVYNAEIGEPELHYYSTISAWKRHLPKTIAEWSAQFKGLNIIYDSE